MTRSLCLFSTISLVVVSSLVAASHANHEEIQLTDGEVLILSGSIDTRVNLRFPLPANARSVYCAMGGGTGDADLYATMDAAVDFEDSESNDCAPLRRGNDEICQPSDFGTPGENLSLGIHAYRGFSGLNIMCFAFPGITETNPPIDTHVPTHVPTSAPIQTDAPTDRPTGFIDSGEIIQLSDGESVQVSGSQGAILRFTFLAPSDATSVRVRMKSGDGDADLRVVTGRRCEGDADDPCEAIGLEYTSENRDTNNEVIVMDDFSSVVSINVIAFADFSGARLKAQALYD